MSAVWRVVLLELDNRGAAPFANKQLYRHEQFSTISCMPRSLRKSSSKGFFQSAKKADVDCGILPPTGTIFAMNSDQSNVKRRQKQVDKLHKAKIKGDPNIGVSTEGSWSTPWRKSTYSTDTDEEEEGEGEGVFEEGTVAYDEQTTVVTTTEVRRL